MVLLPTIVEEIEDEADANSAIHPTRLDEDIPDLVAIDDSDDSDDDEERPVIPTATPPTPPRPIIAPDPVTHPTHNYGTRARDRPRVVWDRRTGGARSLHTRSSSHTTVLKTTLKTALRDPKLATQAQGALEKELLSTQQGHFSPTTRG